MAEASSSKTKAIVFLIMGFVALSFVSFIGYQAYFNYQNQIRRLQQREETMYVIVAYEDLYQGVTITEEQLFAVEIPPKYLYLEGKEKVSGLFSMPEHVVGRIPRERILANEFIREERLADMEAGIGLNAYIPRDQRAITLGVSGGAAVSGFLNPGNYVDVLVTLVPEGAKGELSGMPETHCILQQVYVLAVDQVHRRSGGSRERRAETNMVTLQVTPQMATQIAYAESVGSVSLLLRPDTDDDTAQVPGMTIEDVFKPGVTFVKPAGLPAKVPVKAKGTGITVCKGTDCDTIFR